MQASNRNHEEKPPNVLYVVLASLFGYPGAGHLMIGQKRTGALFALTFTITTVAMVVEAIPFLISLFRQLSAAINEGTAPPLAGISFPRLILWTVLSLALWAASAVHAAKLAKKVGQQMSLVPIPKEQPPGETEDTDLSSEHLDESVDGQKDRE